MAVVSEHVRVIIGYLIDILVFFRISVTILAKLIILWVDVSSNM